MADETKTEGPTEYGFKFGSALVERWTKDKRGGVVIGVSTGKDLIQVYVTNGGKIRVFDNGEMPRNTKKTAITKRLP